MKNKITNDQQHIIDALSVGDYSYVWEQVKYVGFKKVKDINQRYCIFWDIVTDFDYENNNNFIHFYLKRLDYNKKSENNTFYVTSTRSIINHLKTENISPTECNKSKLTKILKNWSN